MQERARARFPALAGALSFLFPGLGQMYAGQPTLAAILAIPVGILIVAVVAAATVFSEAARNALFSPQFLTALIVLDLALMMWRLFAIMHVGFARPVERSAAGSGQGAGPGAASAQVMSSARAARNWVAQPRRPWEVAFVALLVIVTVVMHAYTGMLVSTIDFTLREVFNPGSATSGNNGGGEQPPLNQPTYHWDGTSRISFLLLGIDSGPFRSEALTDTILVVSIDPVAHTGVMVSIPRDTANMPLPDRRIFASGLYPNKINSLTTIASQNPRLWCPDLPKGANCGVRTLERSVGLYLGIDINYYATVNLQGFADLIDAVGGIHVCLAGKLSDPSYSGPTWYPKRGITIHTGCQQLDGPHALAYARIREGTLTYPDGRVEQQDDFKRAARQQEVLLALRSQFASANWVLALPQLLKAVAETVTTDFPRDQAGNLASLLPYVTGQRIKRVVLSYPQFASLGPNPQLNYLIVPRRDAVRKEMQTLLGTTALRGWYLGTNGVGPPS